MAAKRCRVFESKQQKTVGFVAESLNQLLKNSCKKLKVRLSAGPVLLLEDGTEVDEDDYFMALPDDTLFILTPKKETNYAFWSTATSLIAKMWSASLPPKEQLQPLMNKLVADKEMREALQEMIENTSTNLHDSKECDPEWFKGVDENVSSKDDWMSKCAKARVRGYYIRTKDEMEKRLFNSDSGTSNHVHHKLFVEMFENMREALRKNEFYASYFDRSARQLRLCDEQGSFQCQGEYDEKDCRFNHKLNPYGNRESRILFSTWNLDHIIERSRSIIPAMENAIRDARNRRINWEYFYNLLFVARGTVTKLRKDSNLKLVHIVCHIKTSHTKCTCDRKRYFLPRLRKVSRRAKKR